MPDKLQKMIGLIVLLIAVGGVSCDAVINTWTVGQSASTGSAERVE